MTAWRDALLAALPGTGGAVRTGTVQVGAAEVVAAVWDFRVHGGSFGTAEADAFVRACDRAAALGRPLLTVLATGGTRLQEGMHALVGIPRAALALDRLAAAGLPHVCVAEHPTTGGVWVAVGSTADVRIGVRGATVAFSGPRVVEAMTGVAVPRGTNTAESAEHAGLLDVVVDEHEVGSTVAEVLEALAADEPEPVDSVLPVAVPTRGGWEQVRASRDRERPDGAALLDELLAPALRLRGADDSVAVAAGRLAGRRVVAAALAARRSARPTPGGYALLTRAAALAGRWRVPLVVLVDTPGADALPGSEQGGVAAAIASAMRAVLGCAAPTVAVVHGEGGSGGALAGAVCDTVAVTELGWFAPLGPEGAAATLRTAPDAAADGMHLTPHDLLAAGFADALAPHDPVPLRAWLAATLDALGSEDQAERLERRAARWAGALRGRQPQIGRNRPHGEPGVR